MNNRVAIVVGLLCLWSVGAHEYDASALRCNGGSAELPAALVNDDFCDCLDGSDEPGTSACSHREGRRGAATTGFACVAKGEAAVLIPSARVGDGVCDCCAGTDEPAARRCPNSCEGEAAIRRFRDGMAARARDTAVHAPALAAQWARCSRRVPTGQDLPKI
jgi:protein kinase C substrate 80K-H